jgi:histidyl-tRNA synthetase
VASHMNDLPRVFRVCHIGPVWRADRPQKGRFREFYQCDIDVVGGVSNAHEVEILLASEKALKSLDLGKVFIRISDKRLLSYILSSFGVQEKSIGKVSQFLDKLDKKSHDDVFREMSNEVGVGPVLNRITEFVNSCRNRNEMFKYSKNEFLSVLNLSNNLGHDIKFHDLLDNLTEIEKKILKVNQQTSVYFDPLLVRGMDYYTGPVFEAGLEGVSYSIGGGGRYDGLIGKFAGKDMPAVGFSIGFERILGLLLERATQTSSAASTRVFLINNGQGDADIHHTAERLREAGIAVETYFLDADFGRQMKMAEMLGIGYAIKEYRPLDGTFLVRKLAERKDVSVTLEELKSQLG